MKPDDIPQWAWDEADDTTYDIDTDGRGSIEYTAARIGISRLVMRVRSQAFDEVLERLEKESKRYDRYDPHDTAYAVSKAIRQHSQKGRDNASR